MPKKLPELHEGHAPIALQYAFHEALEALEDCPEGGEPFVPVEGEMFAVTAVFAGMLECTDLVPLRTRSLLEAVPAPARGVPAACSADTYAHWAGLMLRHCRERFAAERQPNAAALRHAAADACASGAL